MDDHWESVGTRITELGPTFESKLGWRGDENEVGKL